jgi:hypothetical protein
VVPSVSITNPTSALRHLMAVLANCAVILDHVKGRLLLQAHHLNPVYISLLIAMFNIFSTILMLLGLSFIV